ncbi:MAG: hypothetical protein AAGM33_09845 [Pseudomonadota bacterium]
MIATLPSAGRALTPWSPVHPQWSEPAGGLLVSWTRRSRSGLLWLDGVEVPLGEEEELYDISIATDNDGIADFSAETSTLEWLIDADKLLQYRDSGAANLLIEVRQTGRYGWSDPLTMEIPI